MFAEALVPREVSLLTRVQRAVTDIDISRADGKAVVKSHETTLVLPNFTEPHLRALLSGDVICAAELPNSLDEGGKLVLVRRLLQEGLLLRAEPHAGTLKSLASVGGKRATP